VTCSLEVFAEQFCYYGCYGLPSHASTMASFYLSRKYWKGVASVQVG